jgi:predicted amidohydrolase YtcJ
VSSADAARRPKPTPARRARRLRPLETDATASLERGLAGDERRRGCLLPGFLADLVVLDRASLACEPPELTEVRVAATMVGAHGSTTRGGRTGQWWVVIRSLA